MAVVEVTTPFQVRPADTLGNAGGVPVIVRIDDQVFGHNHKV